MLSLCLYFLLTVTLGLLLVWVMMRMRSAGQLLALILGSNLLISGMNRLLSHVSLELQLLDLHYVLHVRGHLHNAYMLVGLMLSFVTVALERRYGLKPTSWGWTEHSGR